MSRVSDTVGLFGDEEARRVEGPFTCEWCQKHYKDNDRNKIVFWDMFGNKKIGYCCFEAVEEAVLLHLPDVINWYHQLLTECEFDIEQRRAMLDALGKTLSEHPIRKVKKA